MSPSSSKRTGRVGENEDGEEGEEIRRRTRDDCREGKDEVAGYYGDPKFDIISLFGEFSTKVLMPECWGVRIASMAVTLTPFKMLKIGLVFKGKGLRISKEEDAFYKTLNNIVVFFQPKAWVDSDTELKIAQAILIPHAKSGNTDYESRGLLFPVSSTSRTTSAPNMPSASLFR